MKPKFFGVCLLGALLIGFSAGRIGGPVEAVHAQAQSAADGRYQIVNGTPSMSRNIMLLDTAIGQSWITCENKKEGRSGWCLLFMSE